MNNKNEDTIILKIGDKDYNEVFHSFILAVWANPRKLVVDYIHYADCANSLHDTGNLALEVALLLKNSEIEVIEYNGCVPLHPVFIKELLGHIVLVDRHGELITGK